MRLKRQAYVGLVKRLLKVGLVRTSATCRCQVGLFFVKNKGDRQRLILDCRPANRLFKSPPGVGLVSGDGLSRIERAGPAVAAPAAPMPHAGTDNSLAGPAAEPLLRAGADDADDALAGLDAWLGVGDVKDCFHRLLLEGGPGLQEFFGHPSLRAGELGLTRLGGSAVAPDAPACPLARALPTG